jgi:nitrilase
MPVTYPKVRAAVVQAAPALFDREKTTQKTIKLIQETAANNAQLVLFPEAFIPAYPRGLSFGTVVGQRKPWGRELWSIYYQNSISVPGKTTQALEGVAQEAGVFLAIGVVERERGTLYCTTLYFSPDGGLCGKHRKLKPTGSERIVWGEGDGSTLRVIETRFGKVGGLICWENYMPLARMALYTQGVEFYLAPTADSRPTWQATLQHIACEGRCFVLGCNQFVTKDMYPPDLPGIEELSDQPEILCRGGSAIIGPLGDVLAGPLYDQEGTLYADLDLTEVTGSKFDFDVSGHYSRPDIFDFRVTDHPNPQ